jgi:hypothetical protein
MDLTGKSNPFSCPFGTISPYFCAINKLTAYLCIMHEGIRDYIRTYKTIFYSHADMIFIAQIADTFFFTQRASLSFCRKTWGFSSHC